MNGAPGLVKQNLRMSCDEFPPGKSLLLLMKDLSAPNTIIQSLYITGWYKGNYHRNRNYGMCSGMAERQTGHAAPGCLLLLEAGAEAHASSRIRGLHSGGYRMEL